MIEWNVPSPFFWRTTYCRERCAEWKNNLLERHNRLENWPTRAAWGLTKCKILHLRLKQQHNKPKPEHLQISCKGKNLYVLCRPLVLQWAEHDPAATTSSSLVWTGIETASSSKDMIISLLSPLSRPHWQYCANFWFSSFRMFIWMEEQSSSMLEQSFNYVAFLVSHSCGEYICQIITKVVL